jgi:hypothetical protein
MRRARSRRLMGVRSLAVTCEVCHHEAVLSADGWGDTVLLRALRPRMVCIVWGSSDVPARAGNGEAFVHLRGRDGLRGRNKRGKRRAGRAYRFGPTEGYWEAFP